MIRHCDDADFELIWAIINDGAQAYKGIIPRDRWTDPYMSREKLRSEIADGVAFWGYDDRSQLVGVMGIQQVQEVTLIRHAYVRSGNQKRGIGAQLLSHLLEPFHQASADRNLGGRILGDPFLRESRFQDG